MEGGRNEKVRAPDGVRGGRECCGERFVLNSRRGCVPGDGTRNQGRFGAGAGRKNRRYRGEGGGAEGHEGGRRQGLAPLSWHDRFEYRTRVVGDFGGAGDGRYGRTRRVYAAVEGAERGESG